MTEANTNIKNAVRYYGEGHHTGAHIPFNFALIEDLDKDSDARDIKYAIDRWLTYKPLKRQANWLVSIYFFLSGLKLVLKKEWTLIMVIFLTKRQDSSVDWT